MTSIGHQQSALTTSSRRWWLSMLCAASMLVALSAIWPLQAIAQSTGTGTLGGLELTAPVKHQLWRLQSSWGAWSKAFEGSDAAAADTELATIEEIRDQLGMNGLPDLAAAAAAYALRASSTGDFDQARMALDAAQRLDPDRPEPMIARARVLEEMGDLTGAATSLGQAYMLMWRAPQTRDLLVNNILIWLLLSLLCSGGLFIVILMMSKGARVFYDLARLFSPPLQRVAADLLALALLLWPIFLPYGFVWLAIYWSILLWGYGSISERTVLIIVWLLIGAAPIALTMQQRAVRTSLVPPARLLDNLAERRLYGGMFSDLDVLRSLAPGSAAVTELVADLHRRLGQWEHARAIYIELTRDPQQSIRATATAYNNIGVYHHREGDFATAVNYYRRAIEANPNLPQPFYNLSQAYSQLYDFEQGHQAMARARALATDAVDRWNSRGTSANTSAVAIDGGLRRVAEVRRQLANLWHVPEHWALAALWRRYRALSVAMAAILLAMAVHQLRRQVGYRSSLARPPAPAIFSSPWLRALVPGLASADRESGIAAFFGLLIPVGLVMLLAMYPVLYRLPYAFTPGPWLLISLTGLLLLLTFTIRLGLALGEDRR